MSSGIKYSAWNNNLSLSYWKPFVLHCKALIGVCKCSPEKCRTQNVSHFTEESIPVFVHGLPQLSTHVGCIMNRVWLPKQLWCHKIMSVGKHGKLGFEAGTVSPSTFSRPVCKQPFNAHSSSCTVVKHPCHVREEKQIFVKTCGFVCGQRGHRCSLQSSHSNWAAWRTPSIHYLTRFATSARRGIEDWNMILRSCIAVSSYSHPRILLLWCGDWFGEDLPGSGSRPSTCLFLPVVMSLQHVVCRLLWTIMQDKGFCSTRDHNGLPPRLEMLSTVTQSQRWSRSGSGEQPGPMLQDTLCCSRFSPSSVLFERAVTQSSCAGKEIHSKTASMGEVDKWL